MIQPISFKRHRFPAEVIRYAVWLYFRFTLSVRDVEELLAQRGIEVSREAVRCWVIKFGPLIAANLRRRRLAPTGRWHLDEMVGRCQTKRTGRLFSCLDRWCGSYPRCPVDASPLVFSPKINVCCPKTGAAVGRSSPSSVWADNTAC